MSHEIPNESYRGGQLEMQAGSLSFPSRDHKPLRYDGLPVPQEGLSVCHAIANPNKRGK